MILGFKVINVEAVAILCINVTTEMCIQFDRVVQVW